MLHPHLCTLCLCLQSPFPVPVHLCPNPRPSQSCPPTSVFTPHLYPCFPARLHPALTAVSLPVSMCRGSVCYFLSSPTQPSSPELFLPQTQGSVPSPCRIPSTPPDRRQERSSRLVWRPQGGAPCNAAGGPAAGSSPHCQLSHPLRAPPPLPSGVRSAARGGLNSPQVRGPAALGAKHSWLGSHLQELAEEPPPQLPHTSTHPHRQPAILVSPLCKCHCAQLA